MTEQAAEHVEQVTIPEPPWNRDVTVDPQQRAEYLQSLTLEQLTAFCARAQVSLDIDERCFLENHPVRLESQQAQIVDLERRLRESEDMPRVVHLPDELDLDEAVRRLREQIEWGPGTVQVLPEPRPRYVPLLHVPAEDVCGKEPPAEWRARELRQVFPEAAGVSQCARTPNHPTPCMGVVWVPLSDGRYIGQDVMFP